MSIIMHPYKVSTSFPVPTAAPRRCPPWFTNERTRRGPATNILAWNILHGGGPNRLPEIALRLLELRPDVIALCEFRAQRGGSLRGVLADHGWEYQLVAGEGGTKNGLLLAAREPLRAHTNGTMPWHATGRALLTAELPQSNLWITAAHVPDERSSTDPDKSWGQNRYGSPRALVWRDLLARSKRLARANHVIVGDLNAGRPRLDHQRGKPTGADEMRKLALLGYADAFRAVRGRAREYSWFSRRGTGYRLDHALVSRPLRPAISSAGYDQVPRNQGVSDHAAVLVSLRRPGKPLENKQISCITAQKSL